MQQDYEDILKKNRDRLISLKEVSPQYIKQSDKDGFLQHTQINPENGLNINRIEFNANINIDVFYAFVSDSTRTAELDPTYQGKLLKQINENIAIFYAYGKSPIFLLDARDLVFLRENILLEDGTILVQNKSIEYPECPPIKGIERADMLFQGWFIKKTGPNSINAINIGNMDPKGYIPKAILNQGHKIQLKRAQQIIAHLSGLKQQ